MGFCCSKDDEIEEEERIYIKRESYTEEDIRELGTCDICKTTNTLVSFYLDKGCLCWSCEAIMIGRGGMENIYDSDIERFNDRYSLRKAFSSL